MGKGGVNLREKRTLTFWMIGRGWDSDGRDGDGLKSMHRTKRRDGAEGEAEGGK